MIFSSLIFLLFLFVCLMAHNFCPKVRTKNTVLLVFSLIFYLWGGVLALLLLLGVTVVSWYAGLRIASLGNPGRRRLWLGIAVAVLVVAFAAVRFWELLPWAGEATALGRYAIPMGFAFYTLQMLSYLVDVYHGQVQAQKRFSNLLLYASLFSQSSGGPVVRYGEIQRALRGRKVKPAMVSRGITRFCCGLAKKVLLADSCGAVVATLLGEDINALASAPVVAVWLGSLFFMLQLYLDLSSYADMAIGLGLMFGFRFPENFEYPLVAESLQDFWSRWHKTVLAFFNDYVFMPLGGNDHGDLIGALNLLITWLLFGLWCGGRANFMIWAAYCVVLLLAERLLYARLEQSRPAVRHVWVLGTMFLGFILYRYSDLGMLAVALKGLIGLNGAGFVDAATGLVLVKHLLLVVLSVAACTPVVKVAGARLQEKSLEEKSWLTVRAVVEAACPALLLLLSVMAMVGSQLPTFVFFQF